MDIGWSIDTVCKLSEMWNFSRLLNAPVLEKKMFQNIGQLQLLSILAIQVNKLKVLSKLIRINRECWEVNNL